jgi:LPPG:FO 2-phospho-L-lactate transferase
MASATGPVVVLAGGVGAARFLDGLVNVVPPEDVFVIVNVGDDLELAGLHISPDIDTITYTLAGLVNPETGWGLRDDTRGALDQLKKLGGPAWFSLGDRDLGTHLYRTERLHARATLSAVTAEITAALGVRARIVPVTDQPLRTIVETDAGDLSFQEYFVARGQRDTVHGLRFAGAESCEAAPGVHDAITSARLIIFAPSNPFLSIGPILAVPAIRDCLLTSRASAVAISPIVGGKALKGPAADILRSLGHDVSALGVARLYQDLIDGFVLDEQDAAMADTITAETGVRCIVTPTIMRGADEKRALAEATIATLTP